MLVYITVKNGDTSPRNVALIENTSTCTTRRRNDHQGSGSGVSKGDGAVAPRRKTASPKYFSTNDHKSEFDSLLNEPEVAYCNKLLLLCYIIGHNT